MGTEPCPNVTGLARPLAWNQLARAILLERQSPLRRPLALAALRLQCERGSVAVLAGEQPWSPLGALRLRGCLRRL